MFKHSSIARSRTPHGDYLDFVNNCPEILLPISTWGQFVRHFFSFSQEELKRLQNPLKQVNDGKYLLEK